MFCIPVEERKKLRDQYDGNEAVLPALAYDVGIGRLDGNKPLKPEAGVAPVLACLMSNSQCAIG